MLSVHLGLESLQLHSLFFMSKNEAKTFFRVLKFEMLKFAVTRFHCFGGYTMGFDCCIDKYKSWTRLFKSTWVNQWGPCPLLLNKQERCFQNDLAEC